MKNLFTVEELKCGMLLVRNDAGKPFKDNSFAATVVFKVGFSHDGKKKYGLCNVLTDGFYVGVANTLAELAEHLNEDPRGYRPLTKDEFVQLLTCSSGQCFY